MALAEVPVPTDHMEIQPGGDPGVQTGNQLANTIPLPIARGFFDPDSLPTAPAGFEARVGELFAPTAGQLIVERLKKLDGGSVAVATYGSRIAERRVGVYEPAGAEADDVLPVVLIQTPLGTGTRHGSHNDMVAREFMGLDMRVILSGPPRYYEAATEAVSMGQDANEALGLVQAVVNSGVIRRIIDLSAYGESQGGGKSLAAAAVAEGYCGEPLDDLLSVAPCFINEIIWTKALKEAHKLGKEGMGLITHMKQVGLAGSFALARSISLKDAHHHGIVLPKLWNGDSGRALSATPEGQRGRVEIFGDDPFTDPVRDIDQIGLTSLDGRLTPGLGHLSGILSLYARMQRQALARNAHQRIAQRI